MKGTHLKFLFKIQRYLNITCLILKRKIYIWGTSKDKIKSCLEIIYIIKFTLTLKTNGNVLLCILIYITFLSSCIYHGIITFLYNIHSINTISLTLKNTDYINIIILISYIHYINIFFCFFIFGK